MTHSVLKTLKQTYDSMSGVVEDVFQSPFMNYGYWKNSPQTFRQAHQEMIEGFGDFSSLASCKKVLDVGCGTGAQDFYWMQKFDFEKIVGVDLSEQQIFKACEQLLKKSQKVQSKFHFLHADACELKLESIGTVDRILGVESAYHFPDKNRFYQLAFQFLKPDGLLCLSEPLKLTSERYEEITADRVESYLEPFSSFEKFQILFFVNQIIQSKNKIEDENKNYNLSYSENLEALKNNFFNVEEIREITSDVLPFFLVLRRKVISSLKKTPHSSPKRQNFLSFFASLFLAFFLMENKKLGYFWIRASRK